MLTGAIRGQIDALRNALWTGGVYADHQFGGHPLRQLTFDNRQDSEAVGLSASPVTRY